MNHYWYAYGKKTDTGMLKLSIVKAGVRAGEPDPPDRFEFGFGFGDLLHVFTEEPTEAEKDLLTRKIDTPVILEEPV